MLTFWQNARRPRLIGNCGSASRVRCRGRRCRPEGKLAASSTLCRLFAHSLAELRARVFAVEFRDPTGADLGGTDCFAFVGVSAVAESFRIHYSDHFQYAALAFRM